MYELEEVWSMRNNDELMEMRQWVCVNPTKTKARFRLASRVQFPRSQFGLI
jgi:hypothetical protein